MNILTSYNNQSIGDNNSAQINPHLIDTSNQGRSSLLQQQDADLRTVEIAPANEVLDPKEKTTLHMLFGTEKPEDMNFYSRNQVNQIYKGHLIDISG